HWTENDQKIVDTIYEKIENAALLSYPNYSKEFIIYVDASERGAGSVLYQQNNLIGIFSRKFSKTQANYTVSEKEFLAIYLTLEHFKKIIFGTSITIYTDHANLLHNTEIQSSRINRWKILIEDYAVTLKYTKGVDNQAADTMSRVLFTKFNDIKMDLPKEIYNAQQIELTNNSLDHFDKTNIAKVGTVKLITSKTGRIIIPKSISKAFISYFHDKFEHPGTSSLYKTLRRFYHVEQIKSKIFEVNKECKLCQQYKKAKTNYGKLSGHLSTSTPFKDISSDIYGPIPTTLFKYSGDLRKIWFLTITDRCSRWTVVYLLKRIGSDEVIEKFKNWFEAYEIPKTLLTDNGRQFTSSKINQFMTRNNVKRIFTTPFNPTCNSISERSNQRITDIIRKNKYVSIKKILRKINFALNNNHNRNIQYSPMELLNKYSVADILNRKLNINLKDIVDKTLKLSEKETAKRNEKRRYDEEINVNDLVYKQREVRSNKFEELWDGPYLVVKKSIDGNVFELYDGVKLLKANLKQIRLL
ncbi:MAG: RNase H-like domain-containing protein, partial [Aeromonas sp.]